MRIGPDAERQIQTSGDRPVAGRLDLACQRKMLEAAGMAQGEPTAGIAVRIAGFDLPVGFFPGAPFRRDLGFAKTAIAGEANRRLTPQPQTTDATRQAQRRVQPCIRACTGRALVLHPSQFGACIYLVDIKR